MNCNLFQSNKWLQSDDKNCANWIFYQLRDSNIEGFPIAHWHYLFVNYNICHPDVYVLGIFVWHTFSFRVQKDRLFFVRFSRPKKLERRILMIIQSYRFLAFFQKRKMVGESTSTQVLRDLEISLRTNHIE